MNTRIADGLRLLQDAGLVQGVRGCTPEEIAQVEAQARLTLPATYKDFLSHLGVSAGRFLQGSDFAVTQLPGANRHARELVQSAGSVLPPTAFVFLMHQGYEFLFFDTAEGGDPEVFRFEEGGDIQKVGMTFSTWFLQTANDEIRVWRNLGQ